MEALFFWIFAVGLVGGAVSVVLNRNPVACALSLVTTFVFLAALFVTLEAFFMAAVQVIVYAGAVMVLFLFIIMLLDLKAEAKRPVSWLKIGFAVLLMVGLARVLDQALASLPQGGEVLAWKGVSSVSDAKQVGELLFSKYLLPFLTTSVLLLVATVGVVLLSKREVK